MVSVPSLRLPLHFAPIAHESRKSTRSAAVEVICCSRTNDDMKSLGPNLGRAALSSASCQCRSFFLASPLLESVGHISLGPSSAQDLYRIYRLATASRGFRSWWTYLKKKLPLGECVVTFCVYCMSCDVHCVILNFMWAMREGYPTLYVHIFKLFSFARQGEKENLSLRKMPTSRTHMLLYNNKKAGWQCVIYNGLFIVSNRLLILWYTSSV